MTNTNDYRPTFLVITNSYIVENFFESLLRNEEPFLLISVKTAEEAYAKLSCLSLDLIIIDDNNDNLSTKAMCAKVRRNPDHRTTPILVISGHLRKDFTTKLIKEGASDFLRLPLDKGEFFHRFEMVSETIETQKKIQTLSTRLDAKSQNKSLKERTLLSSALTKICDHCLKNNLSLALMFIKIDQFNDLLNPQEKKELEKNLAHFFSNIVRAQDKLSNQKNGNFAVLLPKTTTKAALFIAESFQECFSQERFTAQNSTHQFTLSIGISTLSETKDTSKNSSTNLENLMKSAKNALEKAEKMRNTIQIYKNK